jgi:uridylate kinase
MPRKKIVLLKLTGEVFVDQTTKILSALFINGLIEQIKELAATYCIGIVIGGGNFFRGSEHGNRLGISPSIGHQIGMLATMMNGLMLKDLLEQKDVPATLFCAIPSPEVGKPISQQSIENALHDENVLIFTGGTGNPFFTTDTNAVLRALQIGANEIWKGTHVDGIYDTDPKKNEHAQLLSQITYATALEKKLAIMDMTAYALAQQHKQVIRVFNIFAPQALLKAAYEKNFGSIIF